MKMQTSASDYRYTLAIHCLLTFKYPSAEFEPIQHEALMTMIITSRSLQFPLAYQAMQYQHVIAPFHRILSILKMEVCRCRRVLQRMINACSIHPQNVKINNLRLNCCIIFLLLQHCEEPKFHTLVDFHAPSFWTVQVRLDRIFCPVL